MFAYLCAHLHTVLLIASGAFGVSAGIIILRHGSRSRPSKRVFFCMFIAWLFLLAAQMVE